MGYPQKLVAKRLLNRPLVKRDIEIAYANSNSAAEAARYVGVSYKTFKKYAQLYDMWYTNQSGKGVTRTRGVSTTGLLAILDGKHPSYDPTKLLERCIRAAIFKQECYLCGFNERRVDGRTPLLLYFKDGNRTNFKRENLEPRCYNCTYLTTGVINKKLLTMDPGVFQKDLLSIARENNEEIALSDVQSLQEDLLDEIEREREEKNNKQ